MDMHKRDHKSIYLAAINLHNLLEANGWYGDYYGDMKHDLHIVISDCFDELCLYPIFRILDKQDLSQYDRMRIEPAEFAELAQKLYEGADILNECHDLIRATIWDGRKGMDNWDDRTHEMSWVDMFFDARMDYLKEHPEWYKQNHLPEGLAAP